MKFIAEIDIMPLKAILDPQGKAVSVSMKNVGLPQITNVRIGKHITLEVEANSEAEANEKVEEAPGSQNPAAWSLLEPSRPSPEHSTAPRTRNPQKFI